MAGGAGAKTTPAPKETSVQEDLLWRPDAERIRQTNLFAFATATQDLHGAAPDDYDALHRWSVAEPAAFWNAVWDDAGIIGDKGAVVLDSPASMLEAQFFPEATLNFAENLLRRRGAGAAIVFRSETGDTRRLSWDELRAQVSQLQQAFRAEGIGPGDVVAAMLPNVPETIVAMLATASLGALWSSCSPDFGIEGAVDRFGQLAPKLLLVCDGYWYGGKRIELAAKAAAIAARLTPQRVVVVEYLAAAGDVAPAIADGISYDAFRAPWVAGEPEFPRFPFAHPLYVVFSSGTTGLPKCIVHSAGGVLLQHVKEHRLHCDIAAGDRVFYFTTCGWMMWNWLASVLASEATICLYDGSPFHPTGDVLFDFAEDERFSFFGTSAKFIDTLRKSDLEPGENHDFSDLEAISSTGSPLGQSGFRYVYEHVKADVHLASISGGTDILSCFVLGVPTRPVRAGEIQGPGLGMAVDVWDNAGPCGVGRKGELVCTRPFPSMPLGFWNDPGGERYRATYFSRFAGVWCHGDFAEWQPEGGIVIHGRSDATLNPGGVRIGTAEIYSQVEQIAEVAEALCISQQLDDDVRIILFVRLQPGVALTPELEARIRGRIRIGASPRHVPAKIVAVGDIPRTKSGKLAELAVRDVIHGRPVLNTEALANPEALSLYADLPELLS